MFLLRLDRLFSCQKLYDIGRETDRSRVRGEPKPGVCGEGTPNSGSNDRLACSKIKEREKKPGPVSIHIPGRRHIYIYPLNDILVHV